MLRIRLRRVGKKKQPMYRIVVADATAPRDGAFVESIGYYHPLDNPSTIVLDAERARLWLGRGAQPSDRVAKLLAIEGVADLPPKLKARIALGEQRAKEADKAKPKAEETALSEAAPAAEVPAAEEPAAEEEAPAAQSVEEAPAAESAEETPAVGAEEVAEAASEATEEEQPAGEEKPEA